MYRMWVVEEDSENRVRNTQTTVLSCRLHTVEHSTAKHGTPHQTKRKISFPHLSPFLFVSVQFCQSVEAVRFSYWWRMCEPNCMEFVNYMLLSVKKKHTK